MPFNGSFIPSGDLSISVAAATCAAISILGGVLLGKLMPIFAMSFSFISGSISNAAQRKTGFINLFFRKKYFCCIPTQINSLIDGLMSNSKLCGPRHGGLGNSVMGYKSIAPPIALLMCARHPFAIVSRISLAVVCPVNGHPIWRMAHIFKKILKAIKPSIANLYSSATVIFKCFAVWIAAPLLNSAPNAVGSAFRIIVSSVVFVKFLQSFNAFKGCCSLLHFHSLFQNKAYHLTVKESNHAL